jgi:hypothetical protein
MSSMLPGAPESAVCSPSEAEDSLCSPEGWPWLEGGWLEGGWLELDGGWLDGGWLDGGWLDAVGGLVEGGCDGVLALGQPLNAAAARQIHSNSPQRLMLD